MLKLMYLTKRKPGFSFDQFVCRWRQHGALGMSMPVWRFAVGYVQSEPIKPSPIPGTSDDYDAVATFMTQDGMFAEMDDDDVIGAGRMAEDELETFAGPIPETSLWVQENVLKAGELGGICAYLYYADRQQAEDCAALAASRSASLNRLILNLRDDVSLGAAANTLPFAAILELGAPSVPALKSVLDDDLTQPATVAVVTRDAVMWDRRPKR